MADRLRFSRELDLATRRRMREGPSLIGEGGGVKGNVIWGCWITVWRTSEMAIVESEAISRANERDRGVVENTTK